MNKESVVQVAPDGAGKSIRNLSTTTRADQAAATDVLVQQQVLGGIVDANGNPLELATNPLLEELLATSQRQAFALELLVSLFGGSASQDDGAIMAGFQAAKTLGMAVASNQPTNAICDAFGRQITLPWGSRDMFVAGLPGAITVNTLQQLKAAENDTYLDLCLLLLSNTSATAVRIDVTDGTNTYPFQCAAGVITGFSSGLILPASKKNADWSITVASAVTDIRPISLFVRNK